MSAINANARWVDNQHVVDYEIAFDREQELLSELSKAKAKAERFTPSKLNTKYLHQIESLKSELATAQAEEQRMRDDVCWFLTAEEQQAVKELCETQDLVPQGVLRQALRMYQQQVKGPLKLSMLPESDGMEGVLNTELERLTRQLQTAMEERDEARAKANLIALARDANQECYDKACEERDTANSRLEEADKVLRKCVVQLGYCKAGYHLGRKIDEAYDEATALLSRLSTSRSTENKT